MGEGNGFGAFLGLCVGAVVGAGAMYFYGAYIANRAIPHVGRVQEGYVNPNSVELHVRDFECNGAMVPIMRYKGKAYVLKEGPEGRPVPLEYRIQTVPVGRQEQE